MFVVIVG